MLLGARLFRRIILRKKLDDHLFRAPVNLECRHLYNSKKTHSVDASIVCPLIPPTLLLYTVALMEASRLPRPLVGSSVIALLNKLYSLLQETDAASPGLLENGDSLRSHAGQTRCDQNGSQSRKAVTTYYCW